MCALRVGEDGHNFVQDHSHQEVLLPASRGGEWCTQRAIEKACSLGGWAIVHQPGRKVDDGLDLVGHGEIERDEVLVVAQHLQYEHDTIVDCCGPQTESEARECIP